jgi:hypothetical protein
VWVIGKKSGRFYAKKKGGVARRAMWFDTFAEAEAYIARVTSPLL